MDTDMMVKAHKKIKRYERFIYIDFFLLGTIVMAISIGIAKKNVPLITYNAILFVLLLLDIFSNKNRIKITTLKVFMGINDEN